MNAGRLATLSSYALVADLLLAEPFEHSSTAEPTYISCPTAAVTRLSACDVEEFAAHGRNSKHTHRSH
jgi:hypothetical protein